MVSGMLRYKDDRSGSSVFRLFLSFVKLAIRILRLPLLSNTCLNLPKITLVEMPTREATCSSWSAPDLAWVAFQLSRCKYKWMMGTYYIEHFTQDLRQFFHDACVGQI